MAGDDEKLDCSWVVESTDADVTAPESPKLTERISAVLKSATLLTRAIIDPPKRQDIEREIIPYDFKEVLEKLRVAENSLRGFESIVANREQAAAHAFELGMSQSEIDNSKDTILDPALTAEWVSRVQETRVKILDLQKKLQVLRGEGSN